jgi:hypothetical protein
MLVKSNGPSREKLADLLLGLAAMENNVMELMQHVFLPRQPVHDPDLDGPGKIQSGDFVCMMRDAHIDLPRDASTVVHGMLEAWSGIQNPIVQEERVHNSLKILKPGQIFALFLPPQNAAIIVALKSPSVAIVSTFRVSADATDVGSCCWLLLF